TFDPSNRQRIYAGGTVGDGVFKSEDGGLTWARRRFGSSAVNVIPVAVDPLSPNIVYAGTQNEGLFKSADFADTWKSAGNGLSGARSLLSPASCKRAPRLAAAVAAFCEPDHNAETWANVLDIVAWTLAIHSKTPSRVYATTPIQGVFRSVEGGLTSMGIN